MFTTTGNLTQLNLFVLTLTFGSFMSVRSVIVKIFLFSGDVDAESLPHQGIVHIYPLLNLFQKTTRLCLENNYTGVINDQRTYEV